MLKGELLFRLNELWNRRVRTVRVTTYYGGGGKVGKWGTGGRLGLYYSYDPLHWHL